MTAYRSQMHSYPKLKAMQETLGSKQRSELQSNARKTEGFWRGLFLPSSIWGDWAFLCKDTVMLCLKRVRRTLSTRRDIFEQCCNSWQRVTTKLFTSTSEMLERMPPKSRQGFKMISWMPWVANLEKSIVAEVKEARFFSLLADETTDASAKEQLTICLRYVKDGSICERFFGLRQASDLTGSGLPNQLRATLTTAGIPVSYMVGQD